MGHTDTDQVLIRTPRTIARTLHPNARRTFAAMLVALLLGTMTTVSSGSSAAAAAAVATSRVSVASDGTEGNSISNQPSISADGRYVAFSSHASSLVWDDNNNAWDIFVRDRVGGTTSRVSVASDGTEGNSTSNQPSISADGRYVAFSSDASNLVTGDTNGVADVFVKDRDTGTTTRVSVAGNGEEANSDGHFWWERGGRSPSISADGRYVAFSSGASNLVTGDTNGRSDIFVNDRDTGITLRVSVASGGTEANSASSTPSISADGRYIAFTSSASNLVAGDTDHNEDVFVRDRGSATTTWASVPHDGASGGWSYAGSSSPSISADGRYIAFSSDHTGMLLPQLDNPSRHIYLRDRANGTTTRVSVASDGTDGDSWSYAPSITPDGRYVAFVSAARNLTADITGGNYKVFVQDRDTGANLVVSVASDGTLDDRDSDGPSISADGRHVAFSSRGYKLVPDDNNEWEDVFVRSALPTAPEITSGPGSTGRARTVTWNFVTAPEHDALCRLYRGSTVVFALGPCTSAVSETYSLSSQPNGTYTFEVAQRDSLGNQSAFASASYVLDTIAPKVTNYKATPNPFDVRKVSRTKISFSSNEAASFTLVIKKNATEVRKLALAKLRKPGSRNVAWDGRDSKKRLVSAGKYDAVLTATDKAGNRAVKKIGITLRR